ncbi:MAG: methylenetetrahydrofolate reductase [NAD(P)H] [Alphaproteobacteria bacterium]|nr:methylenetetrahydrofolate reductase [NAD(P)H] [Alphaproteobacteria bacterium]
MTLEVSFEFFPPQAAAGEGGLRRTLDALAPLGPRFVSVTCGAGGGGGESARGRTAAIATRIARETKLPVAAHLTCAGASREEIDDAARAYWQAGIRHIVALRGDPPSGIGERYRPHPGGYAYALDLVAGLRRLHEFEISVSAYPEGHPDAPGAAFEIDYLKRKIDAGATRAITQFFFETDLYLRFRDRCRKAGIDCEIVAGILPIANFTQAARFARLCGAHLPSWLGAQFEGLEDDPETRRMVAATVAVEQCRRLESEGVESLHFYTLNRPELTRAICHMVGVRPKLRQSAA